MLKFSEIVYLREAELDVFKQEHMLVTYKFKFIIETKAKNIVFFARTKIERDIWLEGISRIIDFNVTGIPINILDQSHTFSQIQDKSKKLDNSQVLYNSQTNRQTVQINVNGYDVYRA